jgi:pimeloyl-ACP methyl ester carboxylesterase
LKPVKPDGLVVIYMPGGPGKNSISDADPRASNEYGLIETDPRGGGCNDDPRLNTKNISAESIAGDIIAIVNELNLSNFAIHGHSFGTVVATIVASRSPIQPKATILEGAIGHSFGPGHPFGFVLAWEAAFPRFSKHLQDRFTRSEGNPFGLDNAKWQDAVNEYLYLGDVRWTSAPHIQDSLLYSTVQIASGGEAELDLQEAISKGVPNGALPFSQKVWDSTYCTNISSYKNEPMMDFRFGHFIESHEPPVCEGTNALFDARDWQIPGNLIYFVGEHDPATPSWQAEYHFESQSRATRYMIQVPGGGHRSLQFN